jgi:hypothetical protein
MFLWWGKQLDQPLQELQRAQQDLGPAIGARLTQAISING